MTAENNNFVNYEPLKRNWIRQLRRVVESMAHHLLALEYPNANGFLYDHPIEIMKINCEKFSRLIRYFMGKKDENCVLTCAIRMADRRPDWIWPKCTTPVTPTTSSIPSQWFGLENWSSFSGPHGFAPLPQLKFENQIAKNASIRLSVFFSNWIVFLFTSKYSG